MDDADACNVCDGTAFTLNTGYYYCDTCGTQAAEKREVEEHEAEFVNVDEPARQLKHRIKDTTKKEDVELTTWEAYNYILYGFVNELINLGCKEELMLTTLQLWAAYLRRHEVAFFGKEDTSIPRFSFHFKPRDVRILYNIPKKKRARSSNSASSRASSAPKTMRQRKLAYTKRKKSLASAEYEEYRSSQKSDITSISLNLSQNASTVGASSDISDVSKGVRYSQKAKKKARAIMTREHLMEHQMDVHGKLTCHRRLKEADTIGRPFVFAMLWLALNQEGDNVQLSDLLRYAKESHIKYNDISSFIPENVNSSHAVHSFRKSADEFQSHLALRTRALAIAQTINLRELRMPDLSKLCRRYVEELCLPPPIADFADKLIAFCPPRMRVHFKNNPSMAVPNYEGRAMAYILFLMKLFFGLDNDREYRISETAQRINDKLKEFDERQAHLFVWCEWKRFIEMRNIIVAQCHYPTAMHFDTNTEKRPDLFIDYLQKASENSTTQDTYRKIQIDNVKVIFEQVLRLHDHHTEPMPSMSFPPTLTPMNTYMTYIEANQSLQSIIKMPAYMRTRHEQRDFLSYLKPKSLHAYFRHNNMNLKLNRLKYNPQVQFSDVSYVDKKRTALNVQFDFGITDPEWQDYLRGNIADAEKTQNVNQQVNHDNILLDVEEHLKQLTLKEKQMQQARHEQRQQKPQAPPPPLQFAPVEPSRAPDGSEVDRNETISDLFSMHSFQYFDELGKDINFDEILAQPRRNLDEQQNILNADNNHDDSTYEMETDLENTESIDFALSNFDYWICMENIYFQTNQSFAKRLEQLPRNFQWLLKHCAAQIHMHPKDLYIELLAIENQFRYVLKPIFKMNNRILYRKTTNKTLSTRTINAINLLKRIW